MVARRLVKVTRAAVALQTAVARNATVADGEDQQTFAEFPDRRPAPHSPESGQQNQSTDVAQSSHRVGLEASRRSARAHHIRRISGWLPPASPFFRAVTGLMKPADTMKNHCAIASE